MLLFFFLPPVSSNLTSMLQFISLSFIYIMHQDHFLCPACVYEPPTCPRSLTHGVDILSYTPMPTHFLYYLASTVPLLGSSFVSTDSVVLPLQSCVDICLDQCHFSLTCKQSITPSCFYGAESKEIILGKERQCHLTLNSVT